MENWMYADNEPIKTILYHKNKDNIDVLVGK